MSGLDIQLKALAFAYGDVAFLFDAVIEPGSITALMGPSGSGKSTLLNLVAGFETPQSGHVLIGKAIMDEVSPANRPVSMIFQENNLFGHLSVEQNIGLGRSPSLKLSRQDRDAITEALSVTGLVGKEKRLPRELSGGERQRVAIARALVRDKPVLLLDEPFASLGPALRVDMLEEIRKLHARSGTTILFVTHHPDDAQRIASDVLFLEDGRIAAQGSAAQFFGPEAPDAFRRYLGKDPRRTA